MSNRKEELGVKKFCFGEYKCPQCNRIWESSKAWRYYGQKCKHCDKVVNATGLEELFNYICKPCYYRTKGKEGHWKYKLCKEGRKCHSCGENVKPFLTHSEFIKARRLWEVGIDHIDPKKRHKMELCEKCIRLGHYCKNSRETICKFESQSKVEFTQSSSQNVGENSKNGDDSKKNGAVAVPKTGRVSAGVTAKLSFSQVASIGIPKQRSSASEVTNNSSAGEGKMSTLPSKTGGSDFRTFGNSNETTTFRSRYQPYTSGRSRIEPAMNSGYDHVRKNEYLASREGTLSNGYHRYGHSSTPAANPNYQSAEPISLVFIGIIILIFGFFMEYNKRSGAF